MAVKAKLPRPAASGGRVLVVDDYADARESIVLALRHAGHEAQAVSSGAEALQVVEAEPFDVVLTDLQMPGMDGLELVRRLAGKDNVGQVVVLTAHASIPTAVEAMRLGAFDYLEKRFDLQDLEALVQRALARAKARDAHGRLAPPSAAPQLIGSGPAMRQLRETIRRLAPCASRVLILGESGTGKEVVARLLHAQGPRAARPLTDVNSAALSAELAESELFGHVAGAFTGAVSDRPGRFELADGGTVLLDEIGDMELALQAKLLRVLQEGTLQRVGDNATRRVDVCVLACTNRNLVEEIRGGRFRQDLYFRLSQVPLDVPPLRDRREDLPELIEHFVGAGKPPALELFAPCAWDLLGNYHWPGNVRELQNIVRRAQIMHRGTPWRADDIRPWLLAPHASAPQPPGGIPVGLSLREMERKLIQATLDHFQGHRKKTAEALGIGLRTLTTRLKEMGLT